jgi:hypothetical protein
MAEMIKDIIRGDTRTMPITFYSNSVPLDISGAKVFFTMKKRLDMPDDEANIQVIKTSEQHNDPTNGKTTITLTPVMTSQLVPGKYYYDFQIVFPDGSVKTYPKKIGTVNVLFDVTMRTS